MDVMTAIRTRRSVRAYRSDPIAPDALARLKEALRLAPSACNYQPWKFVLVTDAAMREAIAKASRNQVFVAQAPLIVVGVGYPARAYKYMGGSGSSIDIDLAIALDHAMLAARADGLGTCWIGAFDEGEVRRILGLADDAKVVALTPVGFPADENAFHPDERRRRREAEVFTEV
ncbi:MAG: nitroreductase family protein [Planctomycetes bacterium]|nr:nitroreductase family protein [Planctomycetota bacterium]